MSPKSTARLLIVASIAYGIAVAILGALGSSALPLVAMIGALVLGGLWAVRGMFLGGDRS
jgi:hypothetical protein